MTASGTSKNWSVFGDWPPREDPAQVGPYGSYTAKHCPVRIQWDIIQPAEPLTEVAPDLQLRFDMGIEHEAAIVADLRSVAADTWVFIDEDDDPLEATVNAVAHQAPVIVGTRLPSDTEGRRVGEPDLLIRHPDGGYLPVDIKHHLTVRDKDPERPRADAVITTFDDIEAMVKTTLDDVTPKKRTDDALQLAHYRRMLQAAGWACPDGLAGIIGKEGHITWYDLDTPIFQTPAKTERKRAMRTAMERYDFEFGFRLDIAAVAQRVKAGSTEELLVEPMACGECPVCPWHDHCMGKMEAEGDLSLVTGTDYSFWRPLREVGIRTGDDMAQLDPLTARAMASRLDIPGLLRKSADLPDETPLSEIISPRATRQLSDADSLGLATVADLRALDETTIATGLERSHLPELIERARAFAGPAQVYLLPGATLEPISRGDVEVDIDMENGVDNRVYLWGALVTRDAESEYVPFVSWDVLDDQSERELFVRFWKWLSSLREEAINSGQSFRAFCWYSGAENMRLIELSSHDEALTTEVAEFIESPEWVDLYEVFRDRYITGRSMSLKVIAPLAGFDWEAPDAGGGMSMVYHLDAADPASETRKESRRWLLTYNRNDVEATARIRDWIDTELVAPPLPIADTPGGGSRGIGGGEGGI